MNILLRLNLSIQKLLLKVLEILFEIIYLLETPGDQILLGLICVESYGVYSKHFGEVFELSV